MRIFAILLAVIHATKPAKWGELKILDASLKMIRKELTLPTTYDFHYLIDYMAILRNTGRIQLTIESINEIASEPELILAAWERLERTINGIYNFHRYVRVIEKNEFQRDLSDLFSVFDKQGGDLEHACAEQIVTYAMSIIA